MVGVVSRADLLSDLYHSQIRIEVPEQVVGFLEDRAEFIAQPEVDGKVPGDAPVVLNEGGIGPIAALPCGIAGKHGGLERSARKEIFQLRRVEGLARIIGVGSIAAQECNAAACVPESPAGHRVAMNLAAELDGVIARCVGNVVAELRDGVRPLELWPFEATQAGKEVAGKPDTRQSSRERAAYAGVEAIGGLGRCIQIARECRLV